MYRLFFSSSNQSLMRTRKCGPSVEVSFAGDGCTFCWEECMATLEAFFSKVLVLKPRKRCTLGLHQVASTQVRCRGACLTGTKALQLRARGTTVFLSRLASKTQNRKRETVTDRTTDQLRRDSSSVENESLERRQVGTTIHSNSNVSSSRSPESWP